MRLDSYDNKNGYRVVLSDQEREEIRDRIYRTQSKIGWELASYCGLRRQEIEYVRHRDLRKRDTGDWILRVWEDGAKRSKYRETPVPETVATRIQTMAEVNDVSPDQSIIEVSMRTVQRWLKRFCGELALQYDDEGYRHIKLHDGRRTWANSLLDAGVSPMMVMQWGGWDDWRTFRDHYLQDFTEQKQ
ncbi:integrase, partial [Halorubrum ezzemoulense]